MAGAGADRGGVSRGRRRRPARRVRARRPSPHRRQRTRLHAVGENPWALLRRLLWPDRPGLALYRPVTPTVWTLTWSAGGGSPFAFHLFNLVVGALVPIRAPPAAAGDRTRAGGAARGLARLRRHADSHGGHRVDCRVGQGCSPPPSARGACSRSSGGKTGWRSCSSRWRCCPRSTPRRWWRSAGSSRDRSARGAGRRGLGAAVALSSCSGCAPGPPPAGRRCRSSTTRRRSCRRGNACSPRSGCSACILEDLRSGRAVGGLLL
ncbi:MAG: hypothetical protein MZV64_28090 [Ignavibacteriales bacterium]|nr:hypothetical protein [Ignavibacteriales bacterium]